MKKTFTLLIILYLITKTYAMEHNQIITTFTPLEEDETVEWELINNRLELFRCTKETRKEYFSFKNFSKLGRWQVSGDKKKIIYYEWEKYGEIDNTVCFYLIDGPKGEIRYLTNLPRFGVTSPDFNYFLYDNVDIENRKIDVIIYNLNDFSKKVITWKPKLTNWIYDDPYIHLLRQIDDENQFRIYLIGEGGGIIAESIFSIDDNIISSSYEIGRDDEIIHIYDLKFSDYEYGH